MDVTFYWAGPADATVASVYIIERTYDGTAWVEIESGQAATSPYASVVGTLFAHAHYGDTTVNLHENTFASAGQAWLDGEAFITWTSKTGSVPPYVLTGVVWLSGSGIYAEDSPVYEAHEGFTDTSVAIDNEAIVYRIMHVDAAANVSAPAYLWYYYPPIAASSDHTVVIVNIATDLGWEPREGVTVTCYLSTDSQFGRLGQHLDAATSSVKSVDTNDLGLAMFQCWNSSSRVGEAAYTFNLGTEDATTTYTINVEDIPTRPWVLLKDLVYA